MDRTQLVARCLYLVLVYPISAQKDHQVSDFGSSKGSSGIIPDFGIFAKLKINSYYCRRRIPRRRGHVYIVSPVRCYMCSIVTAVSIRYCKCCHGWIVCIYNRNLFWQCYCSSTLWWALLPVTKLPLTKSEYTINSHEGADVEQVWKASSSALTCYAAARALEQATQQAYSGQIGPNSRARHGKKQTVKGLPRVEKKVSKRAENSEVVCFVESEVGIIFHTWYTILSS